MYESRPMMTQLHVCRHLTVIVARLTLPLYRLHTATQFSHSYIGYHYNMMPICQFYCCGSRQHGLWQRSRLFSVVQLVCWYRDCQVASPNQTDRQTVESIRSDPAQYAGPDHVTKRHHVTQRPLARLSRSLGRVVLELTQGGDQS